MSNPSSSAYSPQDFEAAYDSYDDFLADDFVVPSGETWEIDSIWSYWILNDGDYTYSAFIAVRDRKCDTVQGTFTVNGADLTVDVTFNCQPTSVLYNTNISVYPNPATDYFTIDNAAGYNYIITNLKGKIVKQGQIKYNAKNINVNDLNSGVYMLNLNNGQSVYNTKIIIK